MIKITNAIVASCCILLLASCSRIREPIPLNGDKAVYVGTWMNLAAIPAEGKTDNTVLVLNADGSGLYMHCMDYSRSQGGVSSKGHSYNGIGEGFVTSVQNDQIVLSQSSPQLGISLNYTLATRGRPYYEQGNWYVHVEGTTLRKLRPGEESNHQAWPCFAGGDEA